MTCEQAYKVMFKEYPDVLNIDEMSRALDISTKTAYKLLRERRIEFLKVGREYRIPKINIIKYLLTNKSCECQTNDKKS